MATINLNGKSYSGRNVTIRNGKVIIDGKEQKCDDKVINIMVEGDIERLDVGCAEKIAVQGNVGNVNTDTANVDINGHVEGNVTTEVGNVKCGDVGGNVRSEVGNVTCENVNGKVKTEVGDIKYRK